MGIEEQEGDEEYIVGGDEVMMVDQGTQTVYQTYSVMDFAEMDGLVRGTVEVLIKRAEQMILDEDTKTDLWAFRQITKPILQWRENLIS